VGRGGEVVLYTMKCLLFLFFTIVAEGELAGGSRESDGFFYKTFVAGRELMGCLGERYFIIMGSKGGKYESWVQSYSALLASILIWGGTCRYWFTHRTVCVKTLLPPPPPTHPKPLFSAP
jgi:hypothetical protein